METNKKSNIIDNLPLYFLTAILALSVIGGIVYIVISMFIN